ncbi:hypothetical protein PV11_01475 [Exophiala sideris]|uniref:Uncharacterized protein n=1 Tax=Exophiala sideris TaxID=1016849 RepID=A0A0D1YW82_9EURO|nr:hypothetical protein PV11_01475 [Exophiala sideris]
MPLAHSERDHLHDMLLGLYEQFEIHLHCDFMVTTFDNPTKTSQKRGHTFGHSSRCTIYALVKIRNLLQIQGACGGLAKDDQLQVESLSRPALGCVACGSCVHCFNCHFIMYR